MTSVAATKDGFISGGFDGRALMWDRNLSDAHVLFDMGAPIAWVTHLHFHSGHWSTWSVTAERVSVDGSDQHHRFLREAMPRDIAAISNHTENTVCLAYTDRKIACSHLNRADEEIALQNTGSAAVTGLALLDDGWGQHLVVRFDSKAPQLLRVGRDELTVIQHLPEDDIATQTIAALPDGGFLRGGSSGDLDQFTFAGDWVGDAHAHDAPIIAIDVSKDGALAVTGGANGAVTLWQIDELGPAPRAIIAQFAFPVLDLALDERNDRVIVAHAEGHLQPVGFDERAGAQGPAKPARLFAHTKDSEASGHGAKLFNACIACHELGYERGNKMGPPFGGLFGRKVGTVPGYPYSDALKHSELIWTAETLSALFAEGPENYLPGTTMPLQRMPDAADRAALIDHMKQVVEP